MDNPIYWRQGLFLQPQHFQLLERRQDELRGRLAGSGLPHFRGFSGLEVVESSLASGRFEIARAEALFDDGTLASFPGDATLAPRRLDPSSLKGDTPELVYVGLRAWSRDGRNVTETSDPGEASRASTRYTALTDPEEACDLLGDGPPAMVKLMRLSLRLFLQSEVEGGVAGIGDYQLLPVARIIREGEAIRLDASYAPPCLRMGADARLSRMLADVADLVASRLSRLEGYKSPDHTDATRPDLSYLTLFMALRTLARHAAHLRHLQAAPELHPWRVYGELLRLAGELTVFSLESDALGISPEGEALLPPYDHDDPLRCFKSVRDLVASILHTMGGGPELMLTMRKEPPFFHVTLPARVLEGSKSFWLVLVSSESPERMRDLASRLLKLSPSSGMTSILARAVSGIPVAPKDGPPPGLPRRTGAVYCRIDVSSPLWRDVGATGGLSMYLDEAPEDLTAQIAVLGQER